LKAETFNFILGMIYLFIGQVADFCVPMFIGFVITAIEKGEFDKIGPICLQLFIIILVSSKLLLKFRFRALAYLLALELTALTLCPKESRENSDAIFMTQY